MKKPRGRHEFISSTPYERGRDGWLRCSVRPLRWCSPATPERDWPLSNRRSKTRGLSPHRANDTKEEKNMNRIRRMPIVLFALLIAAPLFAQQPASQTSRQTDPSLLSLDTIFTYSPQSLGWHQWQSDGSGYLMLEPSA